MFQGKPVSTWPRSHSAAANRRRKRRIRAGPSRHNSGGRGASQRDEQRQPARKQHGDERNLPFMRAGIDHEGVADPMQAREELAEAEGQARQRGGADRPRRAPCAAVDQQNERGIAQKQKRKKLERRKAQRRQQPRRARRKEAAASRSSRARRFPPCREWTSSLSPQSLCRRRSARTGGCAGA